MPYGRSHTFWWLFGSHGLLLLGALTVLGWLAMRQIERFEFRQAEQNLRIKAVLLGRYIRDLRTDRLSHLQTDAGSLTSEIHSRITFVDRHGTVLADSAHDPALMENHATRPEILAALQDDNGFVVRRSQTTDTTMLYAARKVQRANSPVAFVRVANSVEGIQARLAGVDQAIWVSIAAISGVGLLLVFYLARRIAIPVGELARTAARLAAGQSRSVAYAVGGGELAILGRGLNALSQRLEAQSIELQESHARATGRSAQLLLRLIQGMRAPLSTLKACAETLLHGAMADEANRAYFLEQIDGRADELHRFIDDVRTLARLEAGEWDLQLGPVLLGPIVGACLNRHRARAAASKVVLELLLPGQSDRSILPNQVEVWADEEALHQALDRLIEHALQSAPAGGRIQVCWFQEHVQVLLEIHANETDMSDRGRLRSFDSLCIGDQPRTCKGGGTDLGLAIAGRLLRAMSGTVRAESIVGHGMTLVVVLRPAINT